MTTQTEITEIVENVAAPKKIEGFGIGLTIGFWNGKNSLDKENFRNQDGKDIKSRTAPVSVYLVDMKYLNPVINLAQKIRNNLKSPLHSLQMELPKTEGEGIGQGRRIVTCVVPPQRLAAWYARHKTLVEEFNKAADTFVEKYEWSKEQVAEKLEKDGLKAKKDDSEERKQELKGKLNYPDAKTLRGRFYVWQDVRAASWNTDLSTSISEIAAESGKDEGEILTELAQVEKNKHLLTINRAADQLAASLAANMEETYKQIFNILMTKATGGNARLYQVKVERFVEFFQAVKNGLNITGNEDLERVATKVLDLLDSTCKGDAKTFIETVKDDAEAIASLFEQSLVEVEDTCSKVKRRILIDADDDE